MPIYEYQCTACGEIEEAIQKFSDPPLTSCKRCSGKLTKMISQSSFHLKGTGWYVTDYAGKTKDSDPESKPALSETETKEKSESKAAKSDE